MRSGSPLHRIKRFASIALIATVGIVSSCGGGGSTPLTAKAIDTGLAPDNNGFSFANFGASATSEIFNASDLSTMFGARACTSGSGETCSPTAQAAAWAQMVNEARQSGHCEGLAVQASARFDTKENPPTVELPNEGDVTHGIMRAFATQFLPEVQDATNEWSKKSLVEILNELHKSFQEGGTQYTLGVYTPTGGHAVLPYALEFPSKDLAVIKVYDSNWPGMERYVVIDLKAEQWFFSFSSTNPQKDECAWTGKAGDLDITPISARTAGTCPFCGDGSKVTKSVLLIRSTSSDWSVKTKNGTYSPANTKSVADVSSRAIRSATCDNVVKIPEFVLSTNETDFELTLPDTASAYVSNGNSVVRIVTTGKKQRAPITFTENSISLNDSSTNIQIAVDDVIAQVDTNSSEITINNNSLSIAVDGGSSPVLVNESNPQVVVTDNGTNTPQVEKTTELVTVVASVVEELIPEVVKPGLSPAAERNLTNEAYVKTVEEVPTAPVTAPPMTTTTTIKNVATTLASGASGSDDSSTTSSSPSSPSSSSTSSSTTSTSTTTTAPSNPVRIRFVVYGSGWTPTVKIHTSLYNWDSVDPSQMDSVCTSVSSCNGATYNASYDDYFFLYVTTNQGQSYVGFGPNAGGSSLPGSMYYPARRCNSSYDGYSGITCEVSLYKDYNTFISH
jgi:hypothetical protein